MNPTKEKTDLEKLLESMGTTITIDNPGASTGTITADTITLSSPGPWNTATQSYSNTVIGGGYTVSNTANSGPYTVNSGPYTTSTGISQPWFNNTVGSKICLDGPGADIEVNGRSLIDMIRKIEERLNLLTPNTELETEWEELRALGDEYRRLEQHIKDKQATWDKLKAMPPPVVD